MDQILVVGYMQQALLSGLIMFPLIAIWLIGVQAYSEDSNVDITVGTITNQALIEGGAIYQNGNSIVLLKQRNK